MSLRIHNTLRGRLEEFHPIVPGKVGMYVCGVTVYDRSHIGHARALVTFDVVCRYLRFSGYDVTFVRNLTDVDDKIIRRAQEEGRSAEDVAEANVAAFAEDVAVLGCERPTVEPRATQHIPEMIELIRELEQKGLAYAAGGDVYYAVDKFEGYGKLSNRRLDDMVAGARIEVDERKRHPMDFALWKASKPGEPTWDSPWGPGRPGWHIECSAMSCKYLGQPFDIHGGGNDLIFPHHENEIAQSEGAKGRAFANYWLHNGMVTIAHEKMSKSLGNFMTVRDAAALFGGETLRLFVLGTHYRSPLDFADERLGESKRALVERLYETLARADDALRAKDNAPSAEVRDAVLSDFRAGMDEDFNTARALATVFDTVRALNRHVDTGNWPEALACREALREIGSVLGIGTRDPREVLEEARRAGLADAEIGGEEIERLIAERAKAREAKDFKRADAIRDELNAKGVVLKDTSQGTAWEMER
jgi:cysteinyl-tRNA synthetase